MYSIILMLSLYEYDKICGIKWFQKDKHNNSGWDQQL